MEENENMTAERSLEIITEQIEQSRRTVSKNVGQMLFVGGLCTMATTLLVTAINMLAENRAGHVLWLLLPVIIGLSIRSSHKEHSPTSLVGSLVSKTWWTFATFTLIYLILGGLYNIAMSKLCSPSEFSLIHIKTASYIISLMAMTISITGHILKKSWLVWFGIIGGLLFLAGTAGAAGWLLARFLSVSQLGVYYMIAPCPGIFIFALAGLVLPGWMLKKQSL
jgi:hypothetical protein